MAPEKLLDVDKLLEHQALLFSKLIAFAFQNTSRVAFNQLIVMGSHQNSGVVLAVDFE